MGEGGGLLTRGPAGFGATSWYPLFMALWIIGSGAAIRVSNQRYNQAFAGIFFLCAVAYLAAQGLLESFA